MTTTSQNIAQTILAQLGGNRAVMMMGAKNLVALESGLQFKVGANAKKVTNVVIKLDPSDTYTVEFWNIRGANMRQLAECSDVYADVLKSTVETHTGLYLSL